MTTKTAAKTAATTTKKETAMPAAKSARTTKTAAKKETAMPKTAAKTAAAAETEKPKGQAAVLAIMDERAKFVRKCRRAHKSADLISEPVNFITGRPLNKDGKQVDDLRFIAAEYGWTDNRFATAGQIDANGGKLADGAHFDTMFFAMGDKYRYYKVYNFADIEWPNGEVPTEFKKSGKRAKTTKAKTSAKTKTDTKLATEVSELKSLVAQLAQQNAALLAALSA